MLIVSPVSMLSCKFVLLSIAALALLPIPSPLLLWAVGSKSVLPWPCGILVLNQVGLIPLESIWPLGSKLPPPGPPVLVLLLDLQ